MLTETDLQILRDFLINPDQCGNLYGVATLPDKQGVLILNNKAEKPVDYFITDGQINGIPVCNYAGIILTKKYRDSGLTQTIVLPQIKNVL